MLEHTFMLKYGTLCNRNIGVSSKLKKSINTDVIKTAVVKPGAFCEINTPGRLEVQERMLFYTL